MRKTSSTGTPPRHLDWFAEQGFIQYHHDRIEFLDPVYGEALQAGRPPKSVTEDLIAQVGIKALQQLTQKGVEFHVVLHLNDTPVDNIYVQGMRSGGLHVRDLETLWQKRGH